MSCAKNTTIVGGNCQSCNNGSMSGGSCSMCSGNMKLFGGKKHMRRKTKKQRRHKRGGSFMDTTKEYVNKLDETLGNAGTTISNSVSGFTNNIKNRLSSSESQQTIGGKRKYKRTRKIHRKHKGGTGNSIGNVSQNASSVSGIQTASPQWVNADGPDVPASWYNSVGGRKRKTRTKRRRMH
jgi:hypothetical protein